MEGETGTEMYYLRSGRIHILDGYTRIKTLERGAFFGELALIDGQPRQSTALAVTDCELVVIGAAQFHWLVRQVPAFALQVMQSLANGLRQADDSARIAERLLNLVV